VTTKQPHWRTMIVALSTTSASSKPLLRKALQLAEQFNAGLRLVHIITPAYAFIPDELHLR
jgi:K+-sensing histidine kinase KdpD